MLHDVLLCMAGYFGKTISYSRCSSQAVSEKSITVSIPGITRGEESLVRRLAFHGYCYRRLRAFIDRHKCHFTSLYLCAVATAIDEELGDYRQALIDLETLMLQLDEVHLSTMASDLGDHFPFLDVACGLVERLVQLEEGGGELATCKVVEVVYHCVNGLVGDMRDRLGRVFNCVYYVLLSQTISWLTSGCVEGAPALFFIDRPPAMHFRRHVDSCSLMPERVPAFISLPFANMILDVGFKIGQFKDAQSHTPLSTATRSGGDEQAPTFLESFLGEFQSECEELLAEVRRKSVAVHVDALTEYQVVEVAALQAMVGRMNDHIARHLWREYVERHGLLQRLSCLQAVGLMGRGELIDAMLCNAKAMAARSLQGAIAASSSSNQQRREIRLFRLNYLLQEAFHLAKATTTNCHSDIFDEFTLCIPEESDLGVGEGDDASAGEEQQESDSWWRVDRVSFWRHVQLRLPTCDPVLAPLFSAHILSYYQRCFAFLMRWRLISADLHDAWLAQQAAASRTDYAALRCCVLRARIHCVVHALIDYFQVYVIETQYRRLLEKLHADQDGNLVAFAHEAFLISVQSQCFLRHQSVGGALERLAQCIHAYLHPPRLTNAKAEQSPPPTSPTPPAQESPHQQPTVLFSEQHFHGAVVELLDELKTASLGASLPGSAALLPGHRDAHLHHLMQRIDFNGFFKSTAVKNNNTVMMASS